MMKKEKKLKLFEMFAGYGGSSFALKKAGVEFECVGYSEIDKFAIHCYEQNHKGKNFGDCTKIDPNDLPDFDLLTGGFPCQAFSVAGKGLGELDTRGTLFNDIIRIAEAKKPKWMLLENVKGLTTKRHADTFLKILKELARIGYMVDYKIMNTKEHGIPQNRERVFILCELVDKDYDIEKKAFNWPHKEDLKLFLKDILEDDVDEKYYLKESQVDVLLKKDFKMPDASSCIDANNHKGTNLKQYLKKKRRQLVMPCITPNRINKRQNGRRFKNDDEVMFTLNTQDKHGVLLIDVYNKKIKNDGVSICLTEPHHNNLRIHDSTAIRKLTPKECFRLMGFLGDGINLDDLSNTQRYKLAGNGWDINLVSKIFKEMFV